MIAHLGPLATVKAALKPRAAPAKDLRVHFAAACCVLSIAAVKTKKTLGDLGLRSTFTYPSGTRYIEYMKKHDGYRDAGAAGEAWGHVVDKSKHTRVSRQAFAGHETNPKRAKRKLANDNYTLTYGG